METLIVQLEADLRKISADYAVYQKRGNIKEIEKRMPQIQGFVMWFLDRNKFEIEQELYQKMCTNLLEIVKDMERATKEKDQVLMHDAITYGLLEYLELFVETTEDNTDDNL